MLKWLSRMAIETPMLKTWNESCFGKNIASLEMGVLIALIGAGGVNGRLSWVSC